MRRKVIFDVLPADPDDVPGLLRVLNQRLKRKAGARIKAEDVDTQGFTLLMRAAARGHVGLVSALRGHCDAQQLSDEWGQTALMLAAGEGHAACVQLLIGCGDPDQANSIGRTALMVAAEVAQLECVRALLPVCRVKEADNRGNTALIDAARRGNTVVMEMLLPHSNVAACDLGGRRALHWAAERDQHEAIRLLGAHGDQDGMSRRVRRGSSTLNRTALMIAAELGHKASVEALLPLSDPHALTAQGRTALMLAAQAGKIDCVRALLKVSEPCAVDATGDDAFSLAAKNAVYHLEMEGGLTAFVDICRLLSPVGREADRDSKTLLLFESLAKSAWVSSLGPLFDVLAPYANPKSVLKLAHQLGPQGMPGVWATLERDDLHRALQGVQGIPREEGEEASGAGALTVQEHPASVRKAASQNQPPARRRGGKRL